MNNRPSHKRSYEIPPQYMPPLPYSIARSEPKIKNERNCYDGKRKTTFKALCKFKEKDFDEALLAHATPTVLGQLFFNRMQGVAYDVLKTNGLLGKVNREFRNSLGSAYEQNKEKITAFSSA